MKKLKIIALVVFMFYLCFNALFYIKTRYTSENSNLTPVEVISVIDGDTLLVKEGNEQYKVRLNLINTPESVHYDSEKNTEYGVIASDYVKSIVCEGDVVYLQYDQEKEDIYGRRLAYVWLYDDVDINSETDIKEYMLNAILLKNGYGEVVLYNNRAYYKLFLKIENKAKMEKLGLFSY